MLLAWIPSVPVLFAMTRTFRGISEQKATGFGAVAAGFVEAFLTTGLTVTVAAEITAIVLLMRSLSMERPARGFISVLSVGWSALMLILFGTFVWLYFIRMPHP
jgi:lysylphosphatidylglycerol synthetase-like protein (DUF2156 family)